MIISAFVYHTQNHNFEKEKKIYTNCPSYIIFYILVYIAKTRYQNNNFSFCIHDKNFQLDISIGTFPFCNIIMNNIIFSS